MAARVPAARAIVRRVPTYEYKCAEGHTTEAFQKMTDAPLKKCATCGKKVERVLFAPSIHFKGTGFYSTDYGKGGKKSSTLAKSDSGDAKTSGSGEAKTSDSGEAKTSDSGEAKTSDSSSTSTSTTAPKKSDS